MNRKDFLRSSLGCCALAAFAAPEPGIGAASTVGPEEDLTFAENWITDLLATIDKEVDRETAVRLIAGCGQGCVRRHQFKQDLIAACKGKTVDEMLPLMGKVFEVWKEGENVHIRFGEVSPGCYCPAAKRRPAMPNDLHCECSRASHETIWTAALERPVHVEILESVRRGAQTCHFLVHTT